MSDEPPPVVDAAAPDAVERAIGVLTAGGTVVLPTDTVYGVAVLPGLPHGTDRLFDLKGRSEGQPLAVLVADIDQALALVAPPSAEVSRWMAELWPGPLTLVLPRSPSARALPLGGDADTIGVRCPDHDFVRRLAAELGPIATTSANRHGDPTPVDAAAAAESLLGPVDLVIDGGPAGTMASTVVDAGLATWRILRLGAVAEDQLR